MEREEQQSGFRKGIVSKLMHMHLEDKTKVSADAVLLVAELLKVFVHEAAARAARQAQSEDLPMVDIEHVEKILPQLSAALQNLWRHINQKNNSHSSCWTSS